MTLVVARARPLDLDYLCTQVSEQLSAPRTREDADELDDLDPRGRLHQKAAIPVIARPRISAWTSCAPS